jgi:putative ABC transport system substrate-binding protein
MHFDHLRRRDFITLVGGTAAWPLVTRAQHAAMPVVGFLNSASAQAQVLVAAAYRRGLEEAGFVEGKNVSTEYLYADGQYDRLPQMTADLIGRNVAVIVAGGPPAARAAKNATSTVPIVFTSGDDPVQVGLVSSLNHPGGNITGVHIFFTGLESKKLGLLREIIPQGGPAAALVNPSFPNVDIQTAELHSAAQALGQAIQIVNAMNEQELDTAFASMAQSHVSALLVGADPFFASRREQIVSLAALYAIPAVYEQRAFTAAGGLMSYGTNIADAYRQAGVYAGRILKGEKPGDLPVVQSTKFEFVVNLKTAKALGLTFPPGILAIADEVIE